MMNLKDVMMRAKCGVLGALVAMGMTALGAFADSGLPAGYTQVDHLVAPRGSYIDTGYKPNQNTRVVMDVTVQGAGEYWFGCWDEGYNRGAFAFGNDGGGIYAGYGNQGGTFGAVVANGRHTVELDKNVVKVDGGATYTWSFGVDFGREGSLANNLYLFAQNRKGTPAVADLQTSVICHGCVISDNGVQVREFVPCTAPNGRTGLYDQIGQRFYALAIKLPSGYAAVEWIESTKDGKQFIDTGYTANGQTRVELDAVVPVRWEQEDRFGVLFGSRTMNDWTAKAFALQMCTGSSETLDTVRFAYNGAYRQDGGKPFSFGERVTVTCDGQHVEWTGSKAASAAFAAESLASSKSTLYIFADNGVTDDGAKSEAGLNHSVMRLYSFRITEGETPKRNFVPCVRLADAVAGLYDTVEGKFYENSGSGNFFSSASALPFARELTSGTYEITESFAFVAPAMESALKIAEGATVTLNVAEGVIVAVRGGDAFEVWGAGAGVEVPADATLKVTGAGQLVAYGGKGANGCDGMAGGNGSADGSGTFTSGAGGAGGWGGGGAGAGIGGHGASGGGGGNGGKSVASYDWTHTDLDGNAGSNGGAGKNGGTCGTVSIEGTAKVFAYGGAAGSAAGAGGTAGTRNWGEGATYWFCAFGGGGGGGGAKGGSAADIGGGGAGGFGGGGGGSGAYVWGRESVVDEHPGWGAGGQGANNGKSNDGNDHGGAGGAKGAAGAKGGNGTLTVADGAVAYAAESRYSVGRISETVEIFYDNGKLLWVSGGTSRNLAYNVVNNNTGTLGTGWYVVKGTVSRTNRILVSGAANLVLLHGSSLTADCRGISDRKEYAPGIEVCDDNSLRVFGTETGILSAMGSTYAAGIGTARRFYSDPSGSAWYFCNSCGTIAVFGGTVTATGGEYGAGIGGGMDGAGGMVTINGGEVTATGGWHGAGIGGGRGGSGGTVTINGGEVTARRGGDAEDIGRGRDGGESGTLTLAQRVFEVGSGHYRTGVVVSFQRPLFLRLASATADAGPVRTTTDGREVLCAIFPGNRLTLNFALNDIGVRLVGDATVQVGLVKEDIRLDDVLLPHAEEVLVDSVKYALPDGTCATATNVHPVHCGEDWSIMSGGWYVVTQSISRKALRTEGWDEVNLILSNGTTLDVDGGIQVRGGRGITIYAQPTAGVQDVAPGRLSATGRGDDPGIGGVNVTINGGIVVARGVASGAGIGGGSWGDGGTVTINGGTVTAYGMWGAGIGGGFMGEGDTVTINGGTVTASSDWGSGIGGGGNSDGEQVRPVGTINLGERVEIVEGSIELGSHYVKIAEKKPREMDPIGVCSWSWHEPMTNILARMAANGFKGIQLALSPWVWEGEGSAAQKETFGDQEGEEVFSLISNKFAKGELDIHATMICFSNEDYTTEHTISNTCGLYYGLAPSATAEQKALADLTWGIRSNQFAKAVERTRMLGVRNITAHIGLVHLDDNDMSRLYWACKTCQANGCKLLVETGMYSAEKEVFMLEQFKALHPDAEIGLNFDMANQVLCGADNPTNAYAVMKDWIGQVHVKDCVETYSARGSWATDIEWGRGDVSRTYEMIGVLKADGFAGPMLVEHESGSSDPDVREREILTAVKAIRGESAPVAAGLGEVLGPYLTAVAATNAARGAAFTPSAEVAAVFGADTVAKAAYCAKFGFAVESSVGGTWAVTAGLTPEAWTNVVLLAHSATRQIPVADIAALPSGTPTNVTVKGCCEPGFYYTLYGAAGVRALPTTETKYGPRLCGASGEVTFPEVKKPSDNAGFFSVGVKEAPGVNPSKSVPRPPVPRLGLAQ